MPKGKNWVGAVHIWRQQPKLGGRGRGFSKSWLFLIEGGTGVLQYLLLLANLILTFNWIYLSGLAIFSVWTIFRVTSVQLCNQGFFKQMANKYVSLEIQTFNFSFHFIVALFYSWHIQTVRTKISMIMKL